VRRKNLLSMALVLVAACSIVFTGCKDSSNGGETTQETNDAGATSENKDNAGGNSQTTVDKLKDVFTNFDQRDTWDTTAKKIELSNEDVVIEKEGTYILSGTLDDGQIYVNVDSEEKVQLVLNGVDITCSDSAAIFVENADKVSITLVEGTENILSDGGDKDSSNADGCIYSKDDLSINGSGKLVVNGNVNNGIDCNNDIKIVGGTIEVTAVNNGIKAKQSISIKDGDISVKADDAIKASSNSDDTVGSFYMEGGNLDLVAADDSITATVSIIIAGGKITSDAEGKNTNCDGTEKIAEGCLIKK